VQNDFAVYSTRISNRSWPQDGLPPAFFFTLTSEHASDGTGTHISISRSDVVVSFFVGVMSVPA
jgi:hypothetical protein